MSETRSKYSLKGASKRDIALAAVFTIAFGVLVAVLAFNGPFKAETNANQPIVPTSPAASGDYASVGYGPLLLLPGLGVLIVGIAVIVVALRRKLARIFVGQGMLAWIGVVIIGSLLSGFFDRSIQSAIGSGASFALYGGLSQGLIYALVILAIAVRGLRGGGWRDAVGFGMGYGLVEQMAIGAALLVVTGGVLVSGKAPVELVDKLNGLNSSILVALTPIITGIAFIIVHIGSATLVFYAAKLEGGARWLWLLLAVLYEGAGRSVSIISNNGYNQFSQQWPLAIAIVLWAALGYAITVWMRPRFASLAPADGSLAASKPL